MFDSHMHTLCSDGRQTVEEMCQAAIEKNMAGITFTDHADMNFYKERNHLSRVGECIQAVAAAKEKHKDQLKILCGVELGEYLYAPENAKKILALTDYDAILCSVHLVPGSLWDQPYNRVDFSNEGTDEALSEYIGLYLDLLSDTVDAFDFDVLAHLSCPVRYMTGKHGRFSDMMPYEEKIREILQKLIDRNIALEFNTGGMWDKLRNCTIQNEEIFAIYKSMGGSLITLGSDAHSTLGIGNHFQWAKTVLKEIGFTHYHYFEKRTPVEVAL